MQAYLLPELPWQAKSGGVTTAAAPRSGGGNFVPAPGPGKTTRRRCARCSRRLARGLPGSLRSRSRQLLRQDRNVKRKTRKRSWRIRKGKETTTRPLGKTPQNAAGSQGLAFFAVDKAASGRQISRQRAGTAPSSTRLSPHHPAPALSKSSNLC